MHAYRALWARQMLQRDNRMVDTQIIANLMRSASFFASTTVLIIAGLIAVLGARERAMAVLADLPFAVASSTLLWDLKVLLLIVLFVYAFFKFTWAFRQYNYCLILVGCAAPSLLSAESLRSADLSRASPARPAATPTAAFARTTSASPRSAGSSIPGCSCCSRTGWSWCCTAASSARACCACSRSRPKKKRRSCHPNRERGRGVGP
jgi:hypothetical protein